MARGRGEGSIKKRKDGRWEGQVSIEGNRKSVYGASKGEVLDKLAQVRIDSGVPLSDGADMSLADYLRFYLNGIKKKRSYRTHVSYKYVLDRHVVPYIGQLPLKDLNAGAMLRLEAAHEAANVPPAASWYARNTLRTAIRRAVYPYQLLSVNPFAEVRLERPATRKMTPWTMEEARRFFAAAEARGDGLSCLYVLAVLLGLRHSELLGLKVSDFDFKARTVTIQRQLLLRRKSEGAERTHFTLEPTKTEASSATIAVPEEAIKEVQRHLERRLAAGRREEFLFMTRNGTHLHQSQVRSAFMRSIRDAGVPKIRIHDLRHTCATVLYEAGKDLKEIQMLLRHSNYTVTANTYMHVSQAKARGVADKMDELMRASPAP